MENKTAKQLEKELLYTAKPAVDEESGVFAKAEVTRRFWTRERPSGKLRPSA